MFHVVLFQPEIPPNTGNIIRLCANTGVQLHLIRPLGFELDDKRLRRAGLDYREFASVQEYNSFQDFIETIHPRRIIALSTKGRHCYSRVEYQEGDALIFGPESRGLPAELLASLPEEQVVRLPMLPNSRSLNLSNTVAVVVYEAWRQRGFPGIPDKISNESV